MTSPYPHIAPPSLPSSGAGVPSARGQLMIGALPLGAPMALLPVPLPDVPNLERLSIDALSTLDGALSLIVLATVVFTLLTLGAGTVALCVHGWKRYRERAYREERSAWKSTLMDVLARAAPPEALSDAVRPHQRNRFLSFLGRYATTVRGDERRRIRAVARPFLPVLQKNLKARRPMVRAQAARRIGLFGDEDALSALRDALDDPSETVAWMAMMGLAKRGAARDAPLVIQHLDRLSGIDRRQLTSALVELGEEAAPALRKAMASSLTEDPSRSAFTRLLCAEALRWLADAAAAPIAVSLLDNDADEPELRAGLLRLLRRVGRAHHAPAVRAQCRAEVSFVRIHAARALGQLGDETDEDLLASMLDDESRWVALSAVQSLVELGRTSPIRRLARSEHPRASLANSLLPAQHD